MRSQTTRTIGGKVNADGSVSNAGGGGWTARKNSIGYYEIRLAPGSRLLGSSATLSFGAIPGNQIRSIDSLPQAADWFIVQTAIGTPATMTDLGFTFTATVAI